VLNRDLDIDFGDNDFGDSDFGGQASTGGQQTQFQAGAKRL